METNPEIYLSRLRAMIEPRQQTWDLSPNDVEAISWVLESLAGQAAEMERLKSENARLRADTEGSNDDRKVLRRIIDEASDQYEAKIERLRQSTLTAELVGEIRDTLQRVIPYVRGERIGDTFHPYLSKIDTILSKLPPKP